MKLTKIKFKTTIKQQKDITMKVLGLDFETTGLEASKDRVIEIGAVVWDTDKKKPMALMSELVKVEEKLSPEIIRITGIDDEMLEVYGINGETAFSKLKELVDTCDYIVAHNAKFDRSFFEQEIKNYGVDIDPKKLKWVDTYMDVPYPESIQTRKLSYLAAEHGILNTNAHRALFDVIVMLNILKNYSIDEVVKRAESPSVNVIAKVSFSEKDKAKNLGFRWNKDDKTWFKEFKELDLKTKQFPFEIDVISF